MAEFIRLGYERLFEVRVLHHFWLDEGATVFDEIADQAVEDAAACSPTTSAGCSTSEPSAATAATVAGLRGVFRITGLGFLVAVPGDARPSRSTRLRVLRHRRAAGLRQLHRA